MSSEQSSMWTKPAIIPAPDMAAGGEEVLCRSCKKSLKIPHKSAGSIHLDEPFFDYIVGVKKQKHQTDPREDKLNEFYRSMNALLNEGSGVVILHTEKTYRLQTFNEVVGSRLVSLIPDDSLYHENFDINIYDKEHIVFRVKSRERSLVSFYDFHTKLSLDKGLEDLTHAQFYREIKRLKTSGTDGIEAATGMDKINFSPDGDTFVCKLQRSSSKDTGVDFVESVDIQAKGAPEDEDVVEWIWGNCKLPLYMTAFAKLPHGGSVYIGIAEEKDKNNPNKRTGRCILDIERSRTRWQTKISNDTAQQNIRQQIEWKVKEEVCFLPGGDTRLRVIRNKSDKPNIVDIDFPVYVLSRKSKHGYVVVRVKPFNGLVFFEKTSGASSSSAPPQAVRLGAEYYALSVTEEGVIERQPFVDWPGLS